MSKLVLMGSGETAPSLVSVHRALLAGLANPSCCWLDTPYGFQENADILSAKTAEFFQHSLGHHLQLAHYRSSDEPEVQRQLCYNLVRQSNYLFAGPGSPSYAQLHWSRSELPAIFLEKMREERTILVFASAAACTVGTLCLPVYEIYKVGQEPHWLPGLNLLPAMGFSAVVLPHYNNTVGGNHDTRFCYLGERRLRKLEQQFEPSVWIWGVDEHTALILDFSRETFEVQGKGGFTLRRAGQSQFFETGYSGSFEELRQPNAIENSGLTTVSSPTPEATMTQVAQGLITELVKPIEERFIIALFEGDGLAGAQALLDFEQVLADWSGDSDVHHWQIARAQFRSSLAQMGQAAQRGLGNPREPVEHFVELLLRLRDQARGERQYDRADQIRQGLLHAGIEVRDTPEGTRWTLLSEVLAQKG